MPVLDVVETGDCLLEHVGLQQVVGDTHPAGVPHDRDLLAVSGDFTLNARVERGGAMHAAEAPEGGVFAGGGDRTVGH